MRKLILGAVAAAAALTAAPSESRAQYYPWCLIISDKNGSWSCYYTTREQCMMSAGGNVGFCAQNPASPGPPVRPQRHRPPTG